MMIRILILLGIAFFCGSIGAKLAGASKMGCVTSIVLGFIGGLIGGWISRKMQVPELLSFQGIPIVWSIIGSALFVAVINLISGGNSRNK